MKKLPVVRQCCQQDRARKLSIHNPYFEAGGLFCGIRARPELLPLMFLLMPYLIKQVGSRFWVQADKQAFGGFSIVSAKPNMFEMGNHELKHTTIVWVMASPLVDGSSHATLTGQKCSAYFWPVFTMSLVVRKSSPVVS